MISVTYKAQGAGLDATITLPGKLSGEFVFRGKRQALRPGVNHISLQ